MHHDGMLGSGIDVAPAKQADELVGTIAEHDPLSFFRKSYP